MNRRSIGRAAFASLALAVSACSDATYTGLSPTGRTFYQADAGTKDYYVGVDANFAVDKPAAPQGARAAAEASRNVSPSKPLGIDRPPDAAAAPPGK